MKKLINILVLLVGVVFCAAAQDTVEVKGVVKDEKGAKIEKATVIIKDIVNAEETPVKADEKGEYAFPIKEGKYVFKFQAPGFATKTVIAEIVGNTIIDMDLVKIQNSKTSRL